jgi:hypothetical protein
MMKIQGLPNLAPYTSQSSFKLIESTSKEIQGLNKGFNGETHIGFFHFIGIDTVSKSLLVSKPNNSLLDDVPNIKFIIGQEYLHDNCKILLSFLINNN